MARFLIGIDLGTTNSALAYISLAASAGRARATSSRLPSRRPSPSARSRSGRCCRRFSICPGPHDLPPGATALPWDPAASVRRRRVRPQSRRQGAWPARHLRQVVALPCRRRSLGRRCCPGAPRPTCRASRRSRRRPATCSTWSRPGTTGWPGSGPADRLEKQAGRADGAGVVRRRGPHPDRRGGHARPGCENVTLLEEPQAAFYCWLATHAVARRRPSLKPGDRCLVVDVGGGTSDFSLIEAVEQQGELSFVPPGGRRSPAAGRRQHGPGPGQVRRDASCPGPASSTRPSTACLTQACRRPRKCCSAPGRPPAITVTVMGRGRPVIGGTLHARS